MSAKTKPKIHLIQDEILGILEASPNPMTSWEITQISQAHDEDFQIHKAIGNLKKSGLIVIESQRTGPRGQTQNLYRIAARARDEDETEEAPSAPETSLTDQERDRLARILASDVGEAMDSEWPDALETRAPIDSAHGGRAGDEFDAPIRVGPGNWTNAEIRKPPIKQPSDFVIRAIDQLAEPRLQDGQIHAERLRALADSAVIAPHIDVAAWLEELAATLEDLALGA